MLIDFRPVWIGDSCTGAPASTSSLLKKIDCYASNNHDSLCFMGVDPFLREDIFQLMDYAYENNFRRIKFVTDLNEIKNIEQLMPYYNYGVYFFDVPIFDGYKINDIKDFMKNERTVGTIKSIELMKSSYIHSQIIYKPFIQIHLYINIENVASVLHLTKLFVDLHVDRIFFFINLDHDEYKSNEQNIKRSIQYCIDADCWTLLLNTPPCIMPGYEYFCGDFFPLQHAAVPRAKNDKCPACLFFEVCQGVSARENEKLEPGNTPIKETNLDVQSIKDIVFRKFI
jgi:hypothetical protein